MPLFDLPCNFARRAMGAHDSGHRIFVSNGKRREPKRGGTMDIVLGVCGPGEKGKVGDGREFGKGHGIARIFQGSVG